MTLCFVNFVVHLAGELNGIQAAVAIRREFPRLPSGAVNYTLQVSTAAAFTSFKVNATTGSLVYTPAVDMPRRYEFFG